MIYYTLSPHFIFSANWEHSPELWASLYFTFYSRPTKEYNNPYGSGLVLKTLVSRFYCPSPGTIPSAYEPPVNPIEVEFLNTPWNHRVPISPWGVPGGLVPSLEEFMFGNRGTYKVIVDFMEEGGREIWQLDSAGRMFCPYGDIFYPKDGEYKFRGERRITNIWRKYGDMGFPQLLFRQVFSYKGHCNFVQPPSLLALLPYKNEGNIFLFQYPEVKIRDEPLGTLISIESVEKREGELNDPYYGHLGYVFSETILLNLFYRTIDFFGPFAFSIPSGEGIWTATISKEIKDKMRIEKRTIFTSNLLYEVVNIPEWEYKIRWYLGSNLIKETLITKATPTSFIWFVYPYLKTSGELGLFLFEVDYLPLVMGKENPEKRTSLLYQSGRKVYLPADGESPPDPSNLLFFPKRDYPTILNYSAPIYRLYYLLTHPQVKHRRFSQCFSFIPPFPTFPIGKPSPGQSYNWHHSGNFLMITWDEKGNWHTYDYQGIEISEGALHCHLPPPDILKEKLGNPLVDCVFLSFLLRPEKTETLLFWFVPEDPNSIYLVNAYYTHLLSLLIGTPAYIPWEFCLNPQEPRPIIWGELKLLIWRKGEGVVGMKSLGRYPIQFLFPAIERSTGWIYLPILSEMEGNGEGKFTLFLFKRNDWDFEEVELS